MNSIENLEWRYAVKKFDSEATLTTEQLDAVKQAFNLSAKKSKQQASSKLSDVSKGLNIPGLT